MFIDTHCHLDFPEFDQDRDEVIKRAKSQGIEYIINIGSSIEGSKKSLELAKKYDCIYATVGIHPHAADKFDKKEEAALRELAKKDKVVAIGEIGLDYYAEKSASRSDASSKSCIRDKNYPKADGSTSLTIDPEWNRRVENQRLMFVSSLQLAKDLGLPLVIHSRQARDDTLSTLKETMPVKGVVHCFSGDENFLKECLALGFFISFTCNITYRKADNLRNLVKITPLERLLLETDAPFLPPEGLRGRRNEPLYVRNLASEIARIKEVSLDEVAWATTANAKQFFNIP